MKKMLLIALTAVVLNGCGGVVEDTAVDDFDATNLEPVVQESVYCTQEPTYNDAGAVVYPIDEKYGDLNYLGQLFTAADCGEERLAEFTGGNETYGLGSTIWLNTVPSEGFLEVLLATGYECNENTDSSATCSTWRLDGEVPVVTILTLEGFVGEIKMDDCVNCG